VTVAFYPFTATASSSSGTNPWQFKPETYGAKGNGKVYADGVVTSGSANFSSTNATFTSADVGKYIMINSAQGDNQPPVTTTISTVTDSHHIVVATPLSANRSNVSFAYGTDDTAAVQAAVNAAGAYALANNYFAEVLLGPHIYCLASAPSSITGPPGFLSQIPLPYPNPNGTTQKLILQITGAGEDSPAQYFDSTVPNLQGSVLLSMAQPSASGTPSVIGGPTDTTGVAGGFINMEIVIDQLMVSMPWNCNMIAMDFRNIAAMNILKASIQVFGSPASTQPPGMTIPAGGNSIGLYCPIPTNNDQSNVDFLAVECMTFGIAISEHFTAQRLCIVYCDTAIFVKNSGSAIHGASISYASVEATNTTIAMNSSGQFPIKIGLLDSEVIHTRDIDDGNNALTGEIHWAAFDVSSPTINGGANVRVINDRLGPGIWGSPPSVPATTVSQQNTSYRDANVIITSGGAAVTAIKVDSTTTGLTLGTTGSVTVPVPSGHSISLTYASTAPTWVWVLD